VPFDGVFIAVSVKRQSDIWTDKRVPHLYTVYTQCILCFKCFKRLPIHLFHESFKDKTLSSYLSMRLLTIINRKSKIAP